MLKRAFTCLLVGLFLLWILPFSIVLFIPTLKGFIPFIWIAAIVFLVLFAYYHARAILGWPGLYVFIRPWRLERFRNALRNLIDQHLKTLKRFCKLVHSGCNLNFYISFRHEQERFCQTRYLLLSWGCGLVDYSYCVGGTTLVAHSSRVVSYLLFAFFSHAWPVAVYAFLGALTGLI